MPGANNVSVSCGHLTDTVPLLPTEKTFEIRIYRSVSKSFL